MSQTDARLRQRVELLRRTKVTETEEGCWLWMGARTNAGYGTVAVLGQGRRTNTTAHRLFFAAYHGPISPGHTVHHKCANPPCVNPAHLESVTQRENVAEMFARHALETDTLTAESHMEGLQDALAEAYRQDHEYTPEGTLP